ncbi:hypothetical protein CPR19092_LGOLGGFK_01448 [Companilactobacillus paralimentarius]|jgi:hypothetical protein|uniref:Uncharacterized protein n=1 Tax=Companilactobacillus bobalius TaxID=2801451 RepID=A0A202FFU6_9LACO|nr:hypothetical protein LKACC16343_00422 [Companilactobacillus bobalius]
MKLYSSILDDNFEYLMFQELIDLRKMESEVLPD